MFKSCAQWLCPALLVASATIYVQGQSAPDGNVPKLKAESNLVTVRVVVRDSKGQIVTGLKKEDFKLLDRGKEQTISTFEEEAGSELPPAARSDAKDGLPAVKAEGTAAASGPRRVAFYFDDLNTTQGDLIRARDAADRFLAPGVESGDQIALFSFDHLLTDFTSDRETIHAALAKLNGSSHAKQAVKRCPDLSEYQAQEMLRDSDFKNSSAWQLALAEDNQCSGKPPTSDALPDSAQAARIRAMARELADQNAVKTRGNLDQIERLTKYMAKLAGQRTIVLVSPGFLTGPAQEQLDRIIDEALRSQVVISALDPKGLKVTMREMDASRGIIAQNERTLSGTFGMDQAGTVEAADVLVEFVRGTGGWFFHNDNDLGGGFSALGGHPDTYVLTFAPKDLKKDGKFHELNISLVSRQKGFTVTARRGYFAQERDVEIAAVNPAPAAMKTTSAGSVAAGGASGQMDDLIRDAMLANADSTELPIEVEASRTAGEAALKIHLDARALPFRKDGDHSVDTVTFAAGVFDGNDKAGTIKQRSAKLNVTPEQLQSLIEHGIDLTFTFPVDAGVYRLRAVVTESEGRKVGSASKSIGTP